MKEAWAKFLGTYKKADDFCVRSFGLELHIVALYALWRALKLEGDPRNLSKTRR